MATHKAATEVTLVGPEEKSGFATWVEAHWPKALLLGLLAAGGVLFYQWRNQQVRSEHMAEWGELEPFLSEQAGGAISLALEESRVPDLQAMLASGKLDSSTSGPYAYFALARQFAQDRKYGEALEALASLRSKFPKHNLVQSTYVYAGKVTPKSPVEELEETLSAKRDWEASVPQLFGNPDPAESATRIEFVTDKGTFEVALYEEQAPKHAANFKKLCSEGFYDGTLFHRVGPGLFIQGGDPNTKDPEKDASTWGLGGPEYTLEREKNDLRHFEGVLSGAKKNFETASSGSQFFVTVAPNHSWDGEYVVFGKVLSGLDLVKEISTGDLAEGAQDRPDEPVKVLETKVL